MLTSTNLASSSSQVTVLYSDVLLCYDICHNWVVTRLVIASLQLPGYTIFILQFQDAAFIVFRLLIDRLRLNHNPIGVWSDSSW